MSIAAAVLTKLRQGGATVAVINGRLRVTAPPGILTPELRRTLTEYKHDLLALTLKEGGGTPEAPAADNGTRNEPPSDPVDAGAVGAVLVHSTVLDHGVWLVADEAILTEHPDILHSDCPVFFFDEVALLRSRSADELRQICMVKRMFPTARVIQ